MGNQAIRSIVFLAVLSLGAGAGLIEDYEPFPGEQENSSVTVTADGAPLFVHDHGDGGFAYVQFSFTGSVELAVTSSTMDDRVRPLALHIPATRTGSTLRFTIDTPFNYVVLRYDNGGASKEILLAVFAEAPLTDVPALGQAGVHSAAEYGINATGSATETQKINDAITAISNAGGGTLFFPAGIYRTGTVFMKSNVQVWVDAGAVIQGSTSGVDYPNISSRNLSRWASYTFFFWDHTTNAHLRGNGIVDMRGHQIDNIGDCRHQLFAAARNSGIEGIRIMNSRVWTIHPVESDSIYFKGVRVLNRTPCCYVDQFDIDACRDVLLDNCFTYGGDDATCIKAVVDNRTVIRNITVRNSSLWSTSSNGLRAGANATEGNWSSCTNILFDNVHVLHCGEVAFRIQLCGSGVNDNWRFINCSSEGNSGRLIEMGNYAWNGACNSTTATATNFVWENLDVYNSNSDIDISIGTNHVLKCVRIDGAPLTSYWNSNVSVIGCDPGSFTSVSIAPASAAVKPGETKQFAATAVDQFGQPMPQQPSAFSWSVDGGGTISSAGLFTAGQSEGGPHTVTAQATIGGTTAEGTAMVLVSHQSPGVSYDYYDGVWTSLPDFGAMTPVTSGVTQGFDLSVAQQNDYFAIRFRGFLNVPADGQYTLYTSSDDGSRLYIDDQLVVDNDGAHAQQERSGTITLTQGMHPIEVTFFEAAGGEVLTVSWEGPGISKQQIPEAALFVSDGATTMRMQDVGSPSLALDGSAGSQGKALRLKVSGTQSHSIRLISPSGRVIEHLAGKGCTTYLVPAGDLSRGVYLIDAQIDGVAVRRQVVVP